MQLTKDDVSKDQEDGMKVIDLSKFQQVVEFYEKYKDYTIDHEDKERVKLMKLWNESKEWDEDPSTGGYTNWLFSYCFKDGLK